MSSNACRETARFRRWRDATQPGKTGGNRAASRMTSVASACAIQVQGFINIDATDGLLQVSIESSQAELLLLETPRGLEVRRLALQPGGTGGTPLHDGACHGQMGTVSGPPRRHDRGRRHPKPFFFNVGQGRPLSWKHLGAWGCAVRHCNRAASAGHLFAAVPVTARWGLSADHHGATTGTGRRHPPETAVRS